MPFIIIYHHKGAQRNPWHSNTTHSPRTPLGAPAVRPQCIPTRQVLTLLHNVMLTQLRLLVPDASPSAAA